MTERADRAQVLGYRIAEQGLRRRAKSLRQLDILQLGVQNTPPGSARLACAARLPTIPTDLAGLPVVWSYRISPHLHDAAGLPGLAAALLPSTEAAAVTRLSWPRARLAATGMSAMAVIEQATSAMAEVVTEPMTKGAASAAISKRVDESLTGWCGGCKSQHIYESLFRLAALPAGVRLDTESGPLLLTPIENWRRPPAEPAGLTAQANNYLRFLGPATIAEVADFLSVNKTELAANWPSDLVEVEVDGRVGWFPSDKLAALRKPAEPPRVRLLPPGDPYLQSRDRQLIVPDAKAHKVLWRVLGNPGAMVVDGEILAAWRAKAAGRNRLELVVEPFEALPSYIRADLEAEAARLAEVRGVAEVVLI
ncbi:MAG TPA: crosslink repair DNA glycosylase YcaQ family protein [Pseudonocardiaceae bacterium]|jgi:hypothetical protein|nr:crosslink repair DNA glycosylase YcaQ family protein [Pseudonocardiaceae bacterium]